MIATAVCRMRTGIPVTSAADSELHDRQYFIRPVLCGSAQRASGHPARNREGEFGRLHTWLRNNLYRHGSKFAPNDLVERATGALMQMRPI